MDHRLSSDPTANGLYVNLGSTPPSGPAERGDAPPPGAEPPMRDFVELVSHVLLVIRAKWWWGALAALVVGGLSGWALLHRPVEYEAQTVMLAQGTLDKVVGVAAENENGGDTSVRENVLRNHLSVMNSRKFRVRLINSFGPRDRERIAAPYLGEGDRV